MKKWMLVGLLGSILGYVILIAAPGNYVRMAVEQANHSNYSLAFQIISTFKKSLKIIIVNQAIMWLVNIAILLAIYKRGMLYQIKEIYLAVLFFFSSVGCNLLMAASPGFPDRAAFGSTIFLVIGTIILTTKAFEFRLLSNRKGIFKYGVIICVLSLFVSMGYTAKCYYDLKREDLARIEHIYKEKQAGNFNIELPAFSIKNRAAMNHVLVRDIEVDKNEWINKVMSRYFGVESLKLKE